MSKVYYKSIIPSSTNFSDLTVITEDREVQHFEASDNGKAESEMVSNMQADAVLLALLGTFNDKEKIILLYQILRECGYNLNYEDCAKTLSMTREWYMALLKEIKKRAAKIIQTSAY